jgi:hypothetical protein
VLPTNLCIGIKERGGGAARGRMLVVLALLCHVSARRSRRGMLGDVHHRVISSIVFSTSARRHRRMVESAVLQMLRIAPCAI